MKNRLAEIEKSFGWELFIAFRNERKLKDGWNILHSITHYMLIGYLISWKMKDVFSKPLGGSMQGMTDSGKIPFLPRQPPTVPSSLTKALHASAPAAYIYSYKAKGYGLTTIFASEVLLENIKSTAFWPILIIQHRFLIKDSCNSFLFYMFTGMNNKVISWKRLIYWYLYW